MPPDPATADLLGAVSRTFSLSIRCLPRRLRAPMEVAYLLARTSDTIADTPGPAVEVRLRRLDDFRALVRSTAAADLVAAIQRDVVPGHAGERALVAALPHVLARFAALSAADRADTLELLDEIVAGQAGDLRAFADPGRIAALPDAAALEAYAHAVAGSVGEWWTRICCRHVPRYARLPERELVPLGESLGRGLQLVNILRDMPEDLRAGRCYLPHDELAAAGVDPARLRAEPALAQPVFDRWAARARDHLAAGRGYIRAVRPWRVRFACYVPWRLAEKTLDLMVIAPPLSTSVRVKVSRGAVRATLLGGLAAAVSDRPLR